MNKSELQELINEWSEDKKSGKEDELRYFTEEIHDFMEWMEEKENRELCKELSNHRDMSYAGFRMYTMVHGRLPGKDS